jgi:mersacidin/lichenicidin family type 2 lantibiotic
MDVKVVENADNCVHITMPAPPTGSNELSDEELSNAAGGEARCATLGTLSENNTVCC